MHVAPQTRERAFRILSELLNPSGLLVITFRQGTDAAEQAERGFHDVSADELIGYANRRAIALRGRSSHLQPLEAALDDADGKNDVPARRCPSFPRLGAESVSHLRRRQRPQFFER